MGDMKAQLDQVDDRELDRVAAIIQSMTPQERQDPKILNGSRRSRIARGSGTTVTEVNSLVDRFAQAQQMMRQMGKGGGMPADFRNADHGLKQLNVTVLHGVVFASFAQDMEPIEQYLGEETLRHFEVVFKGRKLRIHG